MRTFAVLVLASGLVQLARPAATSAPGTQMADAAATTIIAGTYWLLAPRFRVWTLHLVMAGGILLGLGSILRSTSPVDAVIISTSLLWTGVLAASIAGRVTSRLYAGLLALGGGAALLQAGVDEDIRLVVVLGLTTIATMELVNRLATRLRHLARTDPLTGLRNRAGLQEAGERARRWARLKGRPVGVAVIDLDGFKAVNDEHGHGAGDELLVATVTAWQAHLGRQDVLARLGGDEFVLLLPGADDEAATAVLDRLAEVSPTPWTHGLAVGDGTDEVAALLEQADGRLVRAKAERPAAEAVDVARSS